MRPAENMKKLIKNVPIKTNAERDKEVLDDVLNALEKSEKDYSAASRSRIWRIIMRNRITKLAAAVFVIAVCVGVYQLGGSRAAFARTTRVVRTTLADLREFASNLREHKPEKYIYESNLPPAEPAKPNPDIQYTIISARVQEFSLVGGYDDLLDFLETESIELDPAAGYPDVSYARLDPDKTEHFTDFARAGDDLKLRSGPKLILKEGHEGTVGSFGADDQDTVAIALAATVLDDDGLIELSFSFLRGQSGFEMPSLEINADEAVLLRLVRTAETEDNSNDEDAPDSENVIFVLIRIEVISPD
jgi:hypothetical protein